MNGVYAFFYAGDEVSELVGDVGVGVVAKLGEGGVNAYLDFCSALGGVVSAAKMPGAEVVVTDGFCLGEVALDDCDVGGKDC